MPSSDIPQRDFFISRAGADAEIAAWVAKELRAVGFTTWIQGEDSHPSGNVFENMWTGAECERTIALLSPDYFISGYTKAELAAAFHDDPEGKRLIFVKVRDCETPKLVAPLIRLSLIDKTDSEKRKLLRDHLKLLGLPIADAPQQVSVGKVRKVAHPLIGREKELKILDDTWARNVRVVAIVAPGGVGKTSLVFHWLEEKKHALGVTRVLGWSFYSQGAIEDRQASADTFLDHALRVWFRDPDPPKDSWSRGERLAELIRSERALLILDGMEPIQQPSGYFKDLGMNALLAGLAADNPGLCICTSRLPLADLDPYAGADESTTGFQKLDLTNLSPEDGGTYLGDLGVQGDAAELRAASEDFGNNALALTLLGPYLVGNGFDGAVSARRTLPALFVELAKGGHARRIMRRYELLLAGQPELVILRMLGLFDRPVDAGVIGVLRKLPFFAVSETEWKVALKRLQDTRLIDGPRTDNSLDCHPLIREHFAEELRQSHLDEFRDGHSQLYEHYSNQVAHRPESLVEMTPLFYALYHGCQAGRHRDAREMYLDRILRGNEFFATKRLGAFGVNLSLLANFFEIPWRNAARGLAPDAQSWLFGQAAFSLRALGRLAESIEPMKLGIEGYLQLGDLNNAALGFDNLSGFQLALGGVTDAIDSAQKSVELAERSGDRIQRMRRRATLANALHLSGDLTRAAKLFSEAEQMQVEDQSEFPILYSVRGGLYCDLLLRQGQFDAVVQRATQTLSWHERSEDRLAVAFDHLSLGCAHAPGSSEAAAHLDEAVKCLRMAGAVDVLPRGLLARAANFRCISDFARAQKDLDEVRILSTRCGMRLHLTDYHLEQARLFLAQSQPDRARPHVVEAGKLITETGYHRRDAEVGQLELETANA